MIYLTVIAACLLTSVSASPLLGLEIGLGVGLGHAVGLGHTVGIDHGVDLGHSVGVVHSLELESLGQPELAMA